MSPTEVPPNFWTISIEGTEDSGSGRDAKADAAPNDAVPTRAARYDEAMLQVIVVLSTFPTVDKASEVASILVEERLAACVNVVPGLTSIYRWEGGIARDAEALVLIKTTRGRFEALAARLAELHPYELPEIVALEAPIGSQSYLDWVRAETR
jgi:periplasmic divalent cation tolerance protein